MRVADWLGTHERRWRIDVIGAGNLIAITSGHTPRGDVSTDGVRIVHKITMSREDAEILHDTLTDFLETEPTAPRNGVSDAAGS